MNLDWLNLPFSYIKTNKNFRCVYKNDTWGEISEHGSEYIDMHIAATCLHYGQECFEGLKAFRGKDDKIRIFRMEENSKRMNNSAKRILMPQVPFKIFKEATIKAVEANQEFVPPYGSGASLYIRPLLIGTGAQIGVSPAKEYTFIVFVTPVGPYFKEGFKPVNIVIDRVIDRAAPKGTGHVKVGGNYAGSLISLKKANRKGYATVLYLDPKEQKYIDECGPANFFAIKDNTYLTPKSDSILPSITNMSLITIAESMGMKTERRKITVDELENFEEVGACGTAAIIVPIKKIVDEDKGIEYKYCHDGNPGPTSQKLYDAFRAIQYGDIEDKWNWNEII